MRGVERPRPAEKAKKKGTEEKENMKANKDLEEREKMEAKENHRARRRKRRSWKQRIEAGCGAE